MKTFFNFSMRRVLGAYTALFLPGALLAQDYTASNLQGRLERVERQLANVERQTYTARSGQNPGAAANSSHGLARQEARIGGIEEQLRQVTGQLENLQHQQQQIMQSLERLQSLPLAPKKQDVAPPVKASSKKAAPAAKDADVPEDNLGGLNAQLEKAKQKPLPQTVQFKENIIASSTEQQALGIEDMSVAESDEVVSIPAAPKADRVAPSPQPSQQDDAPPKKKNKKKEFEDARAVMAKGDYDKAAAEFKLIMKNYPKDALAGAAQYWLGEIYYIKGDFHEASIAFVKAFKGYAKNPKAPDALLKLALSLKELNKKPEACRTLHKLNKDFPAASDSIKRSATKLSQKLKCPAAD